MVVPEASASAPASDFHRERNRSVRCGHSKRGFCQPLETPAAAAQKAQDLHFRPRMADVVLRFIAGRYQGRELPLKADREYLIGRGEEADVRIDEDTVSRRHAILSLKSDEIVLQDCSKNGTYVNGRPILDAFLKHGDQVHIGHTIFKILTHTPAAVQWIIGGAQPARATANAPHRPAAVAASTAPKTLDVAPRAVVTAAPQPGGSARPAAAPVTEHFRGSIGDIAPTDLLQLFATTRKTGTLVLRSRDMVGRIHFVHGRVCHATLDDGPAVNVGADPLKVLYRLLRWSDGTFELEPPDGGPIPHTIQDSTDQILLEAMHQLDELNNLGPDLPPLHAEIMLANPLPAPMRDLTPGDLDFLQLVLRYRVVRAILDHFTGTDFEAYLHLKSLLARRYLTVAGS
jgi:hypothetical protein